MTTQRQSPSQTHETISEGSNALESPANALNWVPGIPGDYTPGLTPARPRKPGDFQPGNQYGRLGKRPPDLARKLCQELVLSNFWEIYDLLWTAVRNSLAKGDISVFKYVSERGFGKMATPVKLQGDPEKPIRIVFSASRPSWLPAEPPSLPEPIETVTEPIDPPSVTCY